MTSILPPRRLTNTDTTLGGDQQAKRVEASIRDLSDFAVQATNTPPRKNREGMIRLAKSPWNPTGLGDGWVYHNGTAWLPMQPPGGASGVSFTPAGTIAATNVQAAIVEASTESLASASAANANANTRLLASLVSAYGLTLIDDADAATARTTLGGTSVGTGVFTATTIGFGVSALGASTVGRNVFWAVDAPAARTAIGATTVGSNVLTAVDAAAGRTAILAPAAPVDTATVGQWVHQTTVAALISAPAGGTWAYFIIRVDAAGVWQDSTAGVVAGGTAVGGAVPANRWYGLFWRIA